MKKLKKEGNMTRAAILELAGEYLNDKREDYTQAHRTGTSKKVNAILENSLDMSASGEFRPVKWT